MTTDPTALAEQINAGNAPLAKLIGLHVTHAATDRVEAALLVRDDLCTLGSTLHGGAIMAFADNCGAIGAFLNLPPGAMTTTIESKTNFMRPVPAGEIAYAVSEPINIGATLQVWQTTIRRADGKIAAIVTQTQFVKAAG